MTGRAIPSWSLLAGGAVVVAAVLGLFITGDRDPAVEAGTDRPSAAAAPQPDPAPRAPVNEPEDKATAKPGNGDQAANDKAGGDRRPERRGGPEELPDVAVEVYNNSTVSGLAGTTAATLQDAGWQVVGTDNWYGSIPASTVYYAPRLKGQAKLLAHEVGATRIRPAVEPMRFDRLTLILTGDL